MSELKLISPLLDNMSVVASIGSHDGIDCYTVKHANVDKLFVLKRISIPQSEEKTTALLLAGAFPDEASAHAYYGRIVDDLKHELSAVAKLADHPNIASVLGYQVEPKESGVGYDFYILTEQWQTLRAFMADNAMTNLKAVNLGIDICNALCALRQEKLLSQNIKPENIFADGQGHFMLGDLGLAGTDDLQFSSLPEQYKSAYTAPEFSDMMASLNLTMDIYALGMVLYRIYNGNHGPFEDEKTSPAAGEKRRLSGEEMPAPIYADYEMAEIILKACAPKQEDRYQSPDELRQALVFYMQRNDITDDLIVPPIVTDPAEDLIPPQMDEEIEPVSFSDINDMDSEFVRSFMPDVSGISAAEEPAEEADALPTEEPADTAAPNAPEELPEADAPDSSGTQAEDEAEPSAECAVEAPPADAAATQEPEAAPDASSPAAQDSGAQEPDAADSQSAALSDSADDSIDTLLSEVDSLLEGFEAEAEPEAPATETLILPETEKKETPQPEEGDGSLHITETAKYTDAPDRPEDTAAEEPSEKKPKKKKYKALLITVCILLALLVGAYFFLAKWYFIEIDAIELVDKGFDFITVSIDSSASELDIRVTCRDAYNNDYSGHVNGNQVTFSGLSSNTQYTIEITAVGKHRLTHSSTTKVDITTYESTQIAGLSAVLGRDEGTVELTVDFAGGLEPNEYLLSYGCSDEAAQTVTFSGNSCVLSGLLTNKTYIFRLEDHDNYFMEGNISTELEVLPIIQADNLRVTAISDGAMTVEWDCDQQTSQPWSVTCSDGGSYSQTVQADACSADFTGTSLSRAYTVTVSAPGLYDDLVLTVPANPIIVENLSVSADGTSLSVSWDSPGGEPEGGWQIEYQIDTVADNPRLVTSDTNSVTIPNVIPDATYTVSIRADASRMTVGSLTASVTTPEAKNFSGYSITSGNVISGLFTRPASNSWTYRDLAEHRDTYAPGEVVAFALQITSEVSKSDDKVVIHSVVRDSSGNPVLVYCSEPNASTTWNRMWTDSRYTGEVDAPETPGTYTLEVYVNGALLGRAKFTVE